MGGGLQGGGGGCLWGGSGGGGRKGLLRAISDSFYIFEAIAHVCGVIKTKNELL